MSDLLARAIADALGSDERPLLAAARLVRRAFAVDRVSIARIDRRSARLEIAASAGAELLATGTTLPVSTCSYFAEVAEDRAFQEEDFDASREFTRPLDSVVIAAGFHAGCSAPIRGAGQPIGAISLSCADKGKDMTQAVRRLRDVCPALAVELTPALAPAPPSVLVCGSDPLAVRGIARLAEQTLQARSEVATTLASALAAAEELAPDVIVCEERLDGQPVDQFAAALRRAGGQKPLLVLATRDTIEDRRAARRAGAGRPHAAPGRPARRRATDRARAGTSPAASGSPRRRPRRTAATCSASSARARGRRRSGPPATGVCWRERPRPNVRLPDRQTCCSIDRSSHSQRRVTWVLR